MSAQRVAALPAADIAILATVAFAGGWSLFFVLVPFLYASNSAEFAGWLEGLAGPLGLVSVGLLVITIRAQNRELQRERERDSLAGCRDLLDSLHKLAESAVLLTPEQSGASADYRRGTHGFRVLDNEYLRNVEVLSPDAVEERAREGQRYMLTHMPALEPFLKVLAALMEAQERLSPEVKALLHSRVRATLPVEAWPVLARIAPADTLKGYIRSVAGRSGA